MNDLQGVKLDSEGYLKDLGQWNQNIARALAHNENIQMTDAHWEIIQVTRDFYQQFDLSPSMRALVKHVEKTLGKEKGRSIYLLKLFPGTPAKLVCKIAGLPKPTNCF